MVTQDSVSVNDNTTAASPKKVDVIDITRASDGSTVLRQVMVLADPAAEAAYAAVTNADPGGSYGIVTQNADLKALRRMKEFEMLAALVDPAERMLADDRLLGVR